MLFSRMQYSTLCEARFERLLWRSSLAKFTIETVRGAIVSASGQPRSSCRFRLATGRVPPVWGHGNTVARDHVSFAEWSKDCPRTARHIIPSHLREDRFWPQAVGSYSSKIMEPKAENHFLRKRPLCLTNLV